MTDNLYASKSEFKKYKTGDYVVMRNDLVVGQQYDGIIWSKEMEDAMGSTTVVRVGFNANSSHYRIKDWLVAKEMISHRYVELDLSNKDE